MIVEIVKIMNSNQQTAGERHNLKFPVFIDAFGLGLTSRAQPQPPELELSLQA
jgi:hypothetical protein